MKSQILAAVCACALISGCATDGFGPKAPTIPDPTVIKAYSTDENAVFVGLEPRDYVHNGYAKVWRDCSDYFDKLELLQNKMAFTGDTVTAVGSGASAILGAAKAKALAISVIATGFSTTSSILTAYQNRALMTPYPTETKSLILAALDEYEKSEPPSTTTDKTDAIIRVQTYAEMCTYSGISRFAKQALAAAKPVNVNQSGGTTAQFAPLASAVQLDLQLTPPLSTDQIVELAAYTVSTNNTANASYKDDKKSAAMFKNMPATISAALKGSDGKAIDPATVSLLRNAVVLLTLAYSENPAFKAAVDGYAPPAATASGPAAPPPDAPAPPPAPGTLPATARIAIRPQ